MDVRSGKFPEVAFSMDEIMADLNGNRDFFMEIVIASAKLFPYSIDAIREAIDERNGTKLCSSAHKLKGMAGTFRAWTVMEMASQLEMMGEMSDLEHAEEKFIELSSEVSRLRRALEQLSHDY